MTFIFYSKYGNRVFRVESFFKGGAVVIRIGFYPKYGELKRVPLHKVVVVILRWGARRLDEALNSKGEPPELVWRMGR